MMFARISRIDRDYNSYVKPKQAEITPTFRTAHALHGRESRSALMLLMLAR